jgi:hypothetical protein
VFQQRNTTVVRVDFSKRNFSMFEPVIPPRSCSEVEDRARTTPSGSAVVIDHPARTMAQGGAAPRPAPQVSDAQPTADYIADMAEELARLAERQRLSVLAYFLDMAATEARAVAAGAR